MRKLRKTGAVDQEGNVVIVPQLPSVTGGNKPPGWNQWTAAQKEDSNPRCANCESVALEGLMWFTQIRRWSNLERD